jgi:SAM-dependent methyltransferase
MATSGPHAPPLDARQRAAIALRRVLPRPARRVVRQAVYALDPVEVALYRRRTGDRAPIPPRGLRERTAVFRLDLWAEAVQNAAAPIDGLLARAGTDLTAAGRVLDFGCGSGKVVAALRGRGPELHCCDLHAPSVAWIARTYPDVHAFTNGYEPPVARPDGHFGLLLAWSVLTHLDRDGQRAWLAEWARLVRPGGIVLATILSEELLPAGDATAAAALARDGVLAVELRKTGAADAYFHGTERPYFDTWNLRAAVPDVLPDTLDLVELVPRALWGKQDCLVLRRR